MGVLDETRILSFSTLVEVLDKIESNAKLLAYEVKPLETNIALTSNVYNIYLYFIQRGERKEVSLILKIQNDECKSVFNYLNFYQREVYTYKEILPSQNALPYPICYISQHDNQSGDFMMILQDLGHHVPGNQFKGCNVHTAAAILEKLAEFHRYWFNSVTQYQSVMTGWNVEQLAFSQKEFKTSWDMAWQHFGDHMPHSFAYASDIMERKYIEIWIDVERHPLSLIHFDLRLDNLIFNDYNELIAVIDWQMARTGNIAYDVSLFIVGNMEPHTMELEYEFLLRHYYACTGLQQSSYSYDDFFQDFRKSLLCHFYREINYLGSDDYDMGLRIRYAKSIFKRYAWALDGLDIINFLK